MDPYSFIATGRRLIGPEVSTLGVRCLLRHPHLFMVQEGLGFRIMA